jgi:hypothetical protein
MEQEKNPETSQPGEREVAQAPPPEDAQPKPTKL